MATNIFPTAPGAQQATGWAKAGLANFTIHDVWHTFASRLVMAGVDFPTVQELMDHQDITMTLRYTFLSSNFKQHAVRTLARAGSGPAIFLIDRAGDAAMWS